jgi:non-heme chloroperoxidase
MNDGRAPPTSATRLLPHDFHSQGDRKMTEQATIKTAMNKRDILIAGATAAGILTTASKVRAAENPSETAGIGNADAGYIRTKDGVSLFCTDYGTGRPMVFLHAWALPSPMWDYQIAHLSERGFRCIAFDRRGHGRSSVPSGGYDFDTLADDLAAVLDTLDLTQVTLVGCSVSSGEMVRYLTRHGASRIARLVFVSPAATPFPTKAADNPDELPAEVYEGFRRHVLAHDYPKWLEENRPAFFTPETSLEMQNWIKGLMIGTPVKVAIECNRFACATDFRSELPQISLPTLVIHGDKDASSPLERGRRTAQLIPGAQFKIYEGAPHGLFVTHMERLNDDLANFAKA